MDVTWKSYNGFGHWYKVPDQINDMVDFLHKKAGVTPKACGASDPVELGSRERRLL